jgi:hypothetical protein
VRRQFFQALLAFTANQQGEALDTWRKVMSTFDPVTLKDGREEYAETCLRLANADGAVMALEKVVEANQNSCERSVILGLAYAQRGMLNRAHFYLDIGLRLADMERPRLTLPSSGKRTLGLRSGILYAATPLDPEIRKEIEPYFVPQS